MATNPFSPLTDDHHSQIVSALKQIEAAKAQVALAKQAGIDVSGADQKIQDAEQKLLAIKRTYFPNK